MSLPPGVILAGGQGARMGGADKAFLTLAGRPLVAHVLARLGPQVSALAVNLRAGSDLPGAEVLRDPVAGQPGPLAGVLAALDWAAARGAAQVVTVPVDAPFLPPDLVARLLAAAGGGAAVAAEADGRWHPATALWPVSGRAAVAGALAGDSRRLREVLAALGARPAIFPAGERDPFRNLNRPEDLAEAEAALAAGQG